MRGKIFGAVTVQTRTYPFLTHLHFYFYKEGIKILPPLDILFELVNPISLAFMIMGDGAIRNKGLLICTDNFTITEVVTLINILIIKYDFNCTIHYDNNYPRIYISKRDMAKVRDLIGPHIIPSMKYKILGNK